MTLLLLSLLLVGPPQERDEPLVDVRASATLMADALVRKSVGELRPQLAGAVTVAPARWFTARLDGAVEGLVSGRDVDVTAYALRARDGWVEFRGGRGDVRAGYGRLVWGRLDELSPSDVVNPLDATKFLFEGRSEARLAVPLVRARFIPSERLTLEAVVNPVFVRGQYDLLDEDTSPFNLTRDAVMPAGIVATEGRRHLMPDGEGVSGGGRALMTLGRLDVGVSTYRGYDGIGPVFFQPSTTTGSAGTEDRVLPVGPEVGITLTESVVGDLVEVHPRFHMYAGDFETVTGPWAWRGEAAYFSRRASAAANYPVTVPATSLDVGLGFDRTAGPLRVFGSFLLHRDEPLHDVDPVRTDYTLVGSVARTLHQDRVTMRGFVVSNPDDRAGFVRGLLSWKLRDRVAIEMSGGTFYGTSDSTVGRFHGRDFVAGRLRVDFR